MALRRCGSVVKAARDREAAERAAAQAAAQNANRNWPGSKVQFTLGPFTIGEFVKDSVEFSYLDKYHLVGPTQGNVVHQMLKNDRVWTNLVVGVGGGASEINTIYNVNLVAGDIEKIVNGYGLAYVGFSILQENWYCGLFIEKIDDTARMYGEVCIGAQTTASQKSAFAEDYRLLIKGIERNPG